VNIHRVSTLWVLTWASALAVALAALAQKNEGPTANSINNVGDAYNIGGGVSAPSVIYKVDPAYSEQARLAQLSGNVVLYVEVEPDGRAHNIRIVKGIGLGLDERAIEAVALWKFKPGLKNGNAVTVRAQIEVNFRYSTDPATPQQREGHQHNETHAAQESVPVSADSTFNGADAGTNLNKGVQAYRNAKYPEAAAFFQKAV
jgi:TonB family protein